MKCCKSPLKHLLISFPPVFFGFANMMPLRKYMVFVYKAVIKSSDFDKIIRSISLLDLHKKEFFYLAIKTAIGVDNLDLVHRLLECNKENGNISTGHLGSQLINVASITGKWAALTDERIQPRVIPQWHFNSFLKERLRSKDFVAAEELLKNAPESMVHSWLSSFSKASFERQAYDLIKAARRGEYNYILLFSSARPHELRLIEYVWKVLFDSTFDSFLPFVQHSLLNGKD